MSILALLDFSLAFDTIDHSILVHHLHIDFVFTDTVLECFSTYLSEQTQCVSLIIVLFFFAPVHSVVPQGSSLLTYYYYYYYIHIILLSLLLTPYFFPCTLNLCLPLLIHILSHKIPLFLTHN